MQVLVRDNNVDQALKALKKKMQREGIFREMKLRNYFEKPSEKKAREKAEAVRRARKLARKKLQREGLLPSKPVVARGGPGGPAAVAVRRRSRRCRRRRWWRRRRRWFGGGGYGGGGGGGFGGGGLAAVSAAVASAAAEAPIDGISNGPRLARGPFSFASSSTCRDCAAAQPVDPAH